MSLEVIGAGFGRTGTLSMKFALEQLGFVKTHHMQEVMPNPGQMKLWHDVGAGKPPQWDRIFDGYRASVDFPSSTYYAELMEHFPEAKVVLTVRDVDKWYQSTANTIHRLTQLFPPWMMRLFPPVRRMQEMVNATVWDRMFDGRFTDEPFAKQVFLDYIDEVKATVPPERLLVFEVAQGWEPLCTFLEVDVPAGPFPRSNDTESFNRRLKFLEVINHLPAIAGTTAGAALLYRMVRR